MINIPEPQKPFLHFCQKVLPLVYDDSLSYYEQLCKLTAKIGEVIDSLNINNEAIKELQDLYVQLKNYVDNYFTDLNIQDQINNKLDEMAEDGTLANIINQEVFSEINTRIDGLSTQIDKINTELAGKPIWVLIGDSWSADDPASVNSRGGGESWYHEFEKIMNIEVKCYAEGGAGFVKKGLVNNRTFVEQLDFANTDETLDKSRVERIIVYGGVNDVRDSSIEDENIITGITQLATSYKTNFSNVPCDVFFYNSDQSNLNLRKLNLIKNASKTISENNMIFHNCATWIADNLDLWQGTVHPNTKGTQRICNFMEQTFNGGTGLLIPINLKAVALKGVSSPDYFAILTSEEYKVSVPSMYFNPFNGDIKGSISVDITSNSKDNVGAGIQAQYQFYTDLRPILPYSKLGSFNYTQKSGSKHALYGNAFATNFNTDAGNQFGLGWDFLNNTNETIELNRIWLSTDLNIYA